MGQLVLELTMLTLSEVGKCTGKITSGRNVSLLKDLWMVCHWLLITIHTYVCNFEDYYLDIF